MDSLRRRPQIPPKQLPRPVEQIEPIPGSRLIRHQTLPQRDELFISRDESQSMDKHLKKQDDELSKKPRIKKVFKWLLLFLFVSVFSIAIYFLLKTYLVSKKINSEMSNRPSFAQNMMALATPIINQESRSPLKGEEDGRINILMLGAAGEHKPGGNLTDTVMVMSIDVASKKVALLSLPRDFYAPIGNSKSFAKLNSLYPIGIKEGSGTELIKNAVEKISGQTLDYYLVVDFEAFEKIVDDIGGINIVSERDIYDPTYPGPNYSYQTFSLSKGFHQLDGATALKYVRERHDDPEGDFGRAKRQQQVIQAVKNKMFSLKTIFNVVALSNILDTLGDNVKTDITIQDMESMIALSKTLDLENISNVVIDAWKPDSLLKVSHVATANGNAFILIPRVGNYSEIHDTASNIFNQEELKKRKEMIEIEKAKITIINSSGNYKLTSTIKELLSEKLNIKDVNVKSDDNSEVELSTTIKQRLNSQKIFTLDELIKKLPAKLSKVPLSESEEENDFIIILGKDLVDVYNYEEDKMSFDEFNKAGDSNELKLN